MTESNPSAPQPAAEGARFDLEVIAQELRESDTYSREGQTARTLTRSADLRTVLVVIRAGNSISEHRTDVSTTVHTLAGHLTLQLPDRTVDLPVGCLLVLGPGLAHDVTAETDSAFLLTLGWPGQE